MLKPSFTFLGATMKTQEMKQKGGPRIELHVQRRTSRVLYSLLKQTYIKVI